MPRWSEGWGWLRRQPRWRRWAVAGLLVVGWVLWRSAGSVRNDALTFVARRGPLEITVLEGGSVQAVESQEVKCEVRVGYEGVKILKIVEEGYQVTEDDVRTNKVLVELDSSGIQKQIVEEEIRYQSSAAALAEAQQAYDIQVNQNLSDIKAAEQKARFGRMDFDKFLGDAAAEKLLADLGLDRLPLVDTNLDRYLTAPTLPRATNGLTERVSTVEPLVVGNGLVTELTMAIPAEGNPTETARDIVGGGTAPPARTAGGSEAGNGLGGGNGALSGVAALLAQRLDVDFTRYADADRLGPGEAKQRLRKLQDDLQIAKKELEQARANREGTRRLLEKEFVTRIDMERDEIAYENSRLKVQTAETAQELFLKYEFAKLAEESLSKYLEAVRELDRARKAAISKLAQAEARLRSAQAQYNVQFRQRKELFEQLEKCTIRAQKPGLVVYGGGDERWWREEQIREGAVVRERQAIITIPDMSRMSVKVRIHESYIKKVQKGQKARVIADAFPDQELTGEVTYVGVLPDSENRWMNPDMKVYRTTVTIDGSRDWLKPGMTAKVEILVDRLTNVVYVPVQAVVPIDGKQFCYVARRGRPERREVEVGQFNDSFIEIQRGLAEGEPVLLRPPDRSGPKPQGQPEKPGEAEKAAPPSSPPSGKVTPAPGSAAVTVPAARIGSAG